MQRETLRPRLKPWIRGTIDAAAELGAQALIVLVGLLAAGVAGIGPFAPERASPVPTWCPADSYPALVHDGESCVINWQGVSETLRYRCPIGAAIDWSDISNAGIGDLTVTGNTTFGNATCSYDIVITLPNPADRDVQRVFLAGGWQVSLYGDAIEWKHGPGCNTLGNATTDVERDRDGRCYSLNVLHVDGTRVPVECP